MKNLLLAAVMLLVSGKMIAQYYPPKIHVAKGDKVVFSAQTPQYGHKAISNNTEQRKYQTTLPVKTNAPEGTVQLYDARPSYTQVQG